MGWSNATFQLLIVTASPTGFSGLFVYSPAPGTGNLVASIAASAGTDPYGNAYRAGITSYNPAGNFSELLSGSMLLRDAAGITTWTIAAAAPSSQPFLQVSSTFPLSTQLFINQKGAVVAQQPGSPGTPENWHALTLGAGWTANVPAPSVKLLAESQMAFTSGLATHAAFSGTSVIVPTGNLPAAYQTTSFQPIPGYAQPSNTPILVAVTGTQIECFGAPAASTGVFWSGMYPLDL